LAADLSDSTTLSHDPSDRMAGSVDEVVVVVAEVASAGVDVEEIADEGASVGVVEAVTEDEEVIEVEAASVGVEEAPTEEALVTSPARRSHSTNRIDTRRLRKHDHMIPIDRNSIDDFLTMLHT